MCSGSSPDGRLVEFIELDNHPFWVGTQAHPEFKSRPDRPGPLFRELIGAALARAEGRNPRIIQLERETAPAFVSGSAAESGERGGSPASPSGRSTRAGSSRWPSAPSRVPTAPPSSATSCATRVRSRWCRCSTTARWRWCASTGPRSTGCCSRSRPASATSTASRPSETARRELVEEVGLEAGSVELLCEIDNAAGFCDERYLVFLARDLRPVDNALQGIEEQHMTVEHLSLDDVPELIAVGELTDAKSVIGLTLTMRRLGR